MVIDESHIADDFIAEWNNPLPYIIAHTSGSTGTPKEIKLLKSDMIKSAEATCRFFNIDSHSTLLLPLSPDYIAGKMMIVRAFISGADLYVEKASSSPLKKDYGVIDLLPIVPSQIGPLLRNTFLSRINNLLIGGGAVPPDMEKEIIYRRINAFASYGMTETCSHIALRNITSDNGIFTTVPGIEIATDSRDCLRLNRHPFSFGTLATNDIIELLDSRHFRWRGRYDNVINSGGIKIYPEECERLIADAIPYPFYIIGRPHNVWGEEAVLYVEAEHPDREFLTALMKSRLPRYHVPHDIIACPHFERTSSGKIKRKLL